MVLALRVFELVSKKLPWTLETEQQPLTCKSNIDFSGVGRVASDEKPNIIWTSKAASWSREVIGSVGEPEAHAFKGFEIICTWKLVIKAENKTISSVFPHNPFPSSRGDDRFSPVHLFIANFCNLNSFYSLNGNSSTHCMLAALQYEDSHNITVILKEILSSVFQVKKFMNIFLKATATF